MQELRAQIQAQLKLADTLRKLGEHAGKCKVNTFLPTYVHPNLPTYLVPTYLSAFLPNYLLT